MVKWELGITYFGMENGIPCTGLEKQPKMDKWLRFKQEAGLLIFTSSIY